jgi:hypothetical protein
MRSRLLVQSLPNLLFLSQMSADDHQGNRKNVVLLTE